MENFEAYGWAQAVKRFWATLMNLLTFIVVDFSESLLKILLSSFVLIAPLPNAMSVYSLSQNQLGFEWYIALPFSAGIEFGPFVMIAISLMLFDGYLKGGKRWWGPFLMTTIATIVLVVVITIIVYWLEMMGGGYKVMSLLPWVSVAAFIGLAALAWHKSQPEIIKAERDEEDLKRKRKSTQRKEDLQTRLLEEKYEQSRELLAAKHARQMDRYGDQPTVKSSKPNGLFGWGKTVKPTVKPTDKLLTLQQPLQQALQSVAVAPEVGGRLPEDPILQYLRDHGPQRTSQLCEHLQVSKPTVFARLKPLVDAGTVSVQRVGQTNVYAIVEPPEAG